MLQLWDGCESVHYNKTGETWPSQPGGNGPTLAFLNPSAPAPSAADTLPTAWAGHIVNLGNPGGVDFGYTAFRMANGASDNGLGDNDGDGIPDVLEYLLGDNPAVSSTAQLPTAAFANVAVGANPAESYAILTNTRTARTGRPAGSGEIQIPRLTRLQNAHH